MQSQRIQWTPQQNIIEATKLKQQGNKYFTQKKYKQALRSYHKAILHLAGIIDKSSSVSAYTNKTASPQISRESNTLKFSIYLNMSQIYIYEAKYEKGIQVLNKAALINQNAKLFYRRGVCNMKISQFERARADLQKVLEKDSKMTEQVNKILTQLKQLQKKQDQKSKNLFQKFFK